MTGLFNIKSRVMAKSNIFGAGSSSLPLLTLHHSVGVSAGLKRELKAILNVKYSPLACNVTVKHL